MKQKSEKNNVRKTGEKASKLGRLIGHDSGKNLRGVGVGKWGRTSLLLIGIILISIILLIIVVSALTDDERISLQFELNSLSGNLTDSGYGWLINQSINYTDTENQVSAWGYVSGLGSGGVDFDYNSTKSYGIVINNNFVNYNDYLKKKRIDELRGVLIIK